MNVVHQEWIVQHRQWIEDEFGPILLNMHQKGKKLKQMNSFLFK
jgi:hypothetical protein